MLFRAIVLLCSLLAAEMSFAQNLQWKPLLKGENIPTKEINEKAIWKKDSFSSEHPTVKEYYVNRKPTFEGVFVPKKKQALGFKKVQLFTTKEIPLKGELPFRDNSKKNIKYLDRAHGLFEHAISDFTEDPDGMIYMSSPAGLATFNGSSMRILGAKTNFKLNEIESLFRDKQGRIWLATAHGLAYIDKNYLYVPTQQIEDYIWKIKEDKDGSLIVSTKTKGVFIIQNDHVLQYDQTKLIESFDAVRDKNNRLWLALPNGIAYLQNDSLFQYKEQVSVGTPRCFYEYNNEMWIGLFYNGIRKIRNDSLFVVEAGVSKNTVFEFRCDHRGIWFSAYGAGIYLIRANLKLVPFFVSDGLTGNGNIYFYIDRFSNIWVSDNVKGFSRIDYNFLDRLPSWNVPSQILEIEHYGNASWYFYNGDYLTKTKNGIRYRIANKATKLIPSNYYLSDGSVIGEDEVWLSNYEFGLTHLKGEKMTYHMTDESFYENTVFNIEIDNSGKIWFRTFSGKLRYFHEGSIHCLSKNPLLERYKFMYVHKGSNSKRIYAVSDKGILVVNEGSYCILNVKSAGLFSNNVLRVFEDQQGKLWIFTEKGIQVFDKNLKIVKGVKTTLFEGFAINSMDQINNDHFLIATSGGLFDLELANGKVKTKVFDQKKGLSLINVYVVKKSGKRIMITSGGDIYYYEPKMFEGNKVKPMLKLDKIFVQSKEFKERKLHIEQGQTVEFHFHLLNWGDESKLRYRLIKKNKKGQWVVQPDQKIVFNQLAHGKYMLEVQLIGLERNSDILSIEIRVQPFFYQKTWFQIFIVLSISGLIFLFIRYRTRKAEKVRLKLEQIVMEKTQDIQAKKLELSKQLDEKELLLKEVNHRVKNNMQMVSSILELQQINPNSLKSNNLLKEASERIKSLSLAHQTLYQNDNYESINILDYIHLLINNLIQEDEVNLDLEIPKELELKIEKAQALGFILNELITNSLKHGWSKTQHERKISLKIRLNKTTNEVQFVYKDNGKGYPKDFDFAKTRSLGSILIKSFAERQLLGTLSFKTEGGAQTEIHFVNE